MRYVVRTVNRPYWYAKGPAKDEASNGGTPGDRDVFNSWEQAMQWILDRAIAGHQVLAYWQPVKLVCRAHNK